MTIIQGRVYARDIAEAIDRIGADIRRKGYEPMPDKPYRIWHARVQDKLGPGLVWYEYNAEIQAREGQAG
jgi:hypothetical protein